MTTTYPSRSYPVYKHSGIPWLGDIPKHWILDRLKRHVANVTDYARELEPNGLYLLLEQVESWTGKFRITGGDVTFGNQAKCFRAGDVLFSKLRPYLAKVTSSSQDGLCSGEFLVLRCRDYHLLSSYLEYLLRSKPVIDAVDSSTYGAKMPRTNWDFVGSMQLPVPPLSEQAVIARFLHYVDRRIQRYISVNKKLILLLEEYKRAIVHQVITGEIDVRHSQSYSIYKDSGVAWLGKIPEHWAVDRLKRHVANITDYAGELESDEVCLLLEHVESWTGKLKAIGGNVTLGSKAKCFRVGDVLFGKLRPYLAKVTAPSQDGFCSGEFLVLRCRDHRFMSNYLEYLLRSKPVIDAVDSSTYGAKMPRTNWDFIGNMQLPVPPLSEQKAIVRHLDETIAGLNSLIVGYRHQVELLREFYTRLISDVVTGKLDVRETANISPEIDPVGVERCLMQ